ncbi:hypothetical protein LUZ60_007083 [Juncus effusus]|nr:hypothetical protein LUZ60_007083 [Juncus effusus]
MATVGCCAPVREACFSRFPCLSNRDTRLSIYLKLVVIVLHVSLVGVLFLFDTDLVQKTQDHLWYTVVYLMIFTAALIQYFFICYSSPGYVIDAMREANQTSIEASNLDSISINEESNSNSNSAQIISPWQRKVAEMYPPGSANRNWTCHHCKIIQPPRTKHCADCDKCVLQFDHHCAWLGTCIGKGNHCRFWWYVLLETVLGFWTGFLYLTYTRSKTPIEWWKYIIIIMMFVILSISLILLVALLIFHTYLILTNQTTYEFTRRRRIFYFRGIPEKVHPFSKGMCKNLSSVCCSTESVYKLERIPPIEELERKARAYTCIDVVSCRCC